MKKIILFVQLILLYNVTEGQWTNDTMVNTLIRDTANANAPKIASTESGESYIAWQESDAGDFGIHIQLLDSNGYKQWIPEGIFVHIYTQAVSYYSYDLECDKFGNVVIALMYNDNGNSIIYLNKIDHTGTFLWGPSGILLIDSIGYGNFSPVLGFTGNNDIVVAWQAIDSVSARWICAQRLSVAGAILWSDPFRIRDTINGNRNYSPRLIPSGADDMNLVYIEESGITPNAVYTLYAQKINSIGANLWPSPILVSTMPLAPQEFPEVISDNADGFFVSFSCLDTLNPGKFDVYSQHVDSTGNLWSPAGTQASNMAFVNKNATSCCYDTTSGELWVLFQMNVNQSSGVFVQKFDSTGNILFGSNALAIQPIIPNGYVPATINIKNNGIIVGYTYQGGLSYQTLHAAILDFQGLIQFQKINLCGYTSMKLEVCSGKVINDNLVFVWTDWRINAGIFAQNLHGDGNTGITTGLQLLSGDDEVRIFPNPSSVPALLFKNYEKRFLKIYNLNNQLLYQTEIEADVKEFKLNECENLTTGIYFMEINYKKNINTLKWLKY